MISSEKRKEFYDKLATRSREELLEIIKEQNPQYIKHIERIELVFRYKMRHLTWDDGTPVKGRDLTNVELASLVDPPFIFDEALGDAGFTEAQQKHIFMNSDPVLWTKYYLPFEHRPRVYQALVLRDPSNRRIMRFGRRLGKTRTIAYFCLWYAFVNKNARIIIVAPMKSHVGLIFDEIIFLAKQNHIILNPEVSNCAISRFVTSPQYEINFEENNSSIKFFTTGMKSNGKADVVRGQEADVLILDEMDYMGKDDLISLLAMMQKTNEFSTHKKKIIAASTPTGQRNKFWDWNRGEAGFKPFWFPSYVNPGWDQETEDQMHLDYPNEQAYRHEVEADWGEDTEGVYPHKFVKPAFVFPGWEYEAKVETSKADFVFGIDWDKYGAGVNIVVLEICKDDYPNQDFANKIRLCHKEEVRKGDFTYTAAIDRIIELNRIFRPKHIYIDRGSGDTHVEIIRKYGVENPQSNLHRIVQGKQFAETVEIRDPFTKEFIKKRLKILMVDNLYKMLEEERIIFPTQDEQLLVDLMSYVVIRTSITTGDPVFAPGGNTTDHAHDALILAAFAVADNYDELFNMKFETKSVAVSSDVFLPTFSLENKQEEELAKDSWGENKGPVKVKRAFAYNLRGTGGSQKISRKMF